MNHMEPLSPTPDAGQPGYASGGPKSAPGAGGRTRREVVRQGVKLAFVAPVVSTFFARDAVAAGSNHSCYPVGHACGGATLEPCCNGLVCNGGTMLCE